MPYTIKKEGSGYRVHGPSGPKSKKPLTMRKAKAQIAILESKMKEEGHGRT